MNITTLLSLTITNLLSLTITYVSDTRGGVNCDGLKQNYVFNLGLKIFSKKLLDMQRNININKKKVKNIELSEEK